MPETTLLYKNGGGRIVIDENNKIIKSDFRYIDKYKVGETLPTEELKHFEVEKKH